MFRYFRALLNWWNGIPTEPVAEARQQRVGKSAKLQTALEGTLANSIFRLDKDERDAVNAYRNGVFQQTGKPIPHKTKTGQSKPKGLLGMFGSAGDGSKAGVAGEGGEEMIISDDIRITNLNRRGLGFLPALLLGGSAVAGAYMLTKAIYDKQEKPIPSIEVKSGNLKLRHAHEFPAIESQLNDFRQTAEE